MPIESVLPEKLAMLFHHYCEALAPDFGALPSSYPDWEDLAPQVRGRMIAATRLALLDLRTAEAPAEGPQGPRYELFGGGTEGKECGC